MKNTEQIKKHKSLDEELEEIKLLLQKADFVSGLNELSNKKNATTIEELIKKDGASLEKKVKSKTGKPVIISVDCTRNTAEDIEKGGPEFLGYDFVVDQSTVDEMRHYITLLIKKNKQPLIKTYVRYDEELRAEHIWSKADIEKCILQGNNKQSNKTE